MSAPRYRLWLYPGEILLDEKSNDKTRSSERFLTTLETFTDATGHGDLHNQTMTSTTITEEA